MPRRASSSRDGRGSRWMSSTSSMPRWTTSPTSTLRGCATSPPPEFWPQSFFGRGRTSISIPRRSEACGSWPRSLSSGALPRDLVKRHRPRRGHVERANLSRDRDPRQVIAGLPHQRPHAGPFAAEHQRRGHGQVHFAELLVAFRGERDGPDALLLQLLQRPGEVRHSRQGTVFQGARGGLERRGRDASGAILGHHHAVGAEGMRAADQRSEVLRVGHAVEEEQERGAGSAREDVLELRVTELRQLGADALVHAGARAVREVSLGDVLDADSSLRRRLGHAVSPLRPPPFLAALQHHPHDVPGVRLERLEHRIDAVDEPAHCTSTAMAISRFCFSQSFSVQMKKLSVPLSSSLPAVEAVNGTSNSTPLAFVSFASGRPNFSFSSLTAGPEVSASEMGASGETCASDRGTTSTFAWAVSPFFTLRTFAVSMRYCPDTSGVVARKPASSHGR